MTARMTAPPPPTDADMERLMVELEERLAPGHEVLCQDCGKTIVRIAAPARAMVEDALRFGEPDYAHPGYVRCPGPDDDQAARIERVGR